MEKQTADVFIAHAGQQKKGFVDVLRILLEQVHDLKVFVDEHSMRVGTHAPQKMATELDAAAVVVVVLSPEFVRKKHPMGELHTALARQKCPGGPQQQQLCPMYYSLSFDECSRRDFREQYDLQPWDRFGVTEPKPEPEVLDGYAKDIKELCSITGLRQDQARHYQGIYATDAVEAVIRCLQAVGRLPEGYSLGMPSCLISRNASSLIGRAKEEQQVKDSLKTKRCVIISGGPGEGKTALAQKVVWDMWERGELPGGAYSINLAGVFQPATEQESAGMRCDQFSQALAELLLSHLSTSEAIQGQRGGWDAVEDCLRKRDARTRKMLLLFENAEDSQGTPQAAQELAKVLKRLSGFRTVAVLVTSRTLIACGHVGHVGIRQLDVTPAIELLQERCSLPAESWEPDLAQEVAELCGCNALCLTVVGSFISAGRCTLQEAVSVGRVLKLQRGARSGGVSDDEHIVRVRDWLLSYLSEEERQALCRLWMFKGGFGLEMAQAMLGNTNSGAVQALLRDLRDTSCLQPGMPTAASSSAVRYRMHALVGEIFRGEFDALPEDIQCSTLLDFFGLMAPKMALLEELQQAGRWPEAYKLLMDNLLNFQELRFMLQSNAPFSSALSSDSLDQLLFLGDAMARLGHPAESTKLLHVTVKLGSASRGLQYADMLISNIWVPGPECELPARHYEPHPKEAQPLAALVYFHGGGFVAGGLDTHDGICRTLANGVPCVVVSIAYRLAPEHPFPAAPEDCYAATEWVAAHADELGASSGLLAVGGDSVGGNLAASVTIMARDRQPEGPKLAFQLLYYPVVDGRVGLPDAADAYASYAEFGPGSGANPNSEDAAYYRRMYMPVPGDTRFAVNCARLSSLPPALLITAQIDLVRDEGRAYAMMLQAAGVPTEFMQFDGVSHGFLHYGIPQTTQAMNMSVRALKAAFSAPQLPRDLTVDKPSQCSAKAKQAAFQAGLPRRKARPVRETARHHLNRPCVIMHSCRRPICLPARGCGAVHLCLA